MSFWLVSSVFNFLLITFRLFSNNLLKGLFYYGITALFSLLANRCRSCRYPHISSHCLIIIIFSFLSTNFKFKYFYCPILYFHLWFMHVLFLFLIFLAISHKDRSIMKVIIHLNLVIVTSLMFLKITLCICFIITTP